MESALVVVASSPDGEERHHASVAEGLLSTRYEVTVLDLVRLGVATAMTATERRAYHSDQPIVDPLIADHARRVADATAILFVFPTAWWTPPPVLKAWVERTFVPGVSFVIDDRSRLAPALTRLRAVGGITRQERPGEIRRGGDGARRMLLRTLRLNARGRVRTAWVVDPTDDAIRRGLGRM